MDPIASLSNGNIDAEVFSQISTVGLKPVGRPGGIMWQPFTTPGVKAWYIEANLAKWAKPTRRFTCRPRPGSRTGRWRPT